MDPLVLHKIQQSLQELIEQRVLGLNNSNDEIELSFVPPNGDFVASLSSKPVVNCYLIGVAEDMHRRRSDPIRSDLNAEKTQRTLYAEPRYIDISYMFTLWSKDKTGSAQIEHLLLGYLITGLGYFGFFPKSILEKYQLDADPYGVRMTLFGSEYSEKISGQVWQAMGSTPKPSLMLSLSVPVATTEPEQRAAVQDIARALNRI